MHFMNSHKYFFKQMFLLARCFECPTCFAYPNPRMSEQNDIGEGWEKKAQSKEEFKFKKIVDIGKAESGDEQQIEHHA